MPPNSVDTLNTHRGHLGRKYCDKCDSKGGKYKKRHVACTETQLKFNWVNLAGELGTDRKKTSEDRFKICVMTGFSSSILDRMFSFCKHVNKISVYTKSINFSESLTDMKFLTISEVAI